MINAPHFAVRCIQFKTTHTAIHRDKKAMNGFVFEFLAYALGFKTCNPVRILWITAAKRKYGIWKKVSVV
jgi:hypothetical protein